MNYVELNALAGDGNTVWPFWQRLEYADKLGPWCLVSDPAHQKRKLAWRDQYLTGMAIHFVDEVTTLVATGVTLITADLAQARLFANAGGFSVWVEKSEFHAVSGGDTMQWLASVAVEGFNAI